MTPRPVTETRDGVVYLLVPLPEVERDDDEFRVDGWSWGVGYPESVLRSVMERGAAAAAVLHARQAERTPTPEETTVSETDDRCPMRMMLGEDDPADAARCIYPRGHDRRHAFAFDAPTPEPRPVTVDLSLPLRDRLTEQERGWLDHVFNEYVEPDPRVKSGAYCSLRAALDRTEEQQR